MAQTAAHLVDRVFPDVPIREWVLSVPKPLRLAMAMDASLCRDVTRAHLRAVSASYVRRAKAALDRAEDEAELAALVPHPREHQLTYQGVLAPALPLRDQVVPRPVIVKERKASRRFGFAGPKG
ncbi:MAG: hypothetical protein ACJAZN_001581 [Planctomycetota bacterium]|jgi:hypothetical protein